VHAHAGALLAAGQGQAGALGLCGDRHAPRG
jgi:hypothetical protein